jgi:hypothetical protein
MNMARRWLECGLCKHWSGFYDVDFRATRRIFLTELKLQVQADVGDILPDSHPVIGAVCPPCEMENIVAYLKKTFTQKQVMEVDISELVDTDFRDESQEHSSSSSSSHEPDGNRSEDVVPVNTEQTRDHEGAKADGEVPWMYQARSSRGWLPTKRSEFELPEYLPQDIPATKTDGQPCSHYQRDLPQMFHTVSKTLPPRLVMSAPEYVYNDAQSILQQWMEKRADLLQVLERPITKPYLWTPAAGEALDAVLHSVGTWFWCVVRDNKWKPPPPEGTDFTTRTFRGTPFETFIHTSNMYVVHKAMIGGLTPGKEVGKGGLIGVYAYRPTGNKAALSSSGYAVYSDLAKNGLYFSPRFELAVNMGLASNDGKKMSAGDQQYALPPGYYHITGVWFHCVSGNDITSGKCTAYTMHDDWHPGCELSTRRHPSDAVEHSNSPHQ